MTTVYRPQISKATQNYQRPAADWLNPRRRHNAELLMQYVLWHGRKVRFDANNYDCLQEQHGLDAYQVDAAADDLHAIGCGRIYRSGGTFAIEILTSDIDRWARKAVG